MTYSGEYLKEQNMCDGNCKCKEENEEMNVCYFCEHVFIPVNYKMVCTLYIRSAGSKYTEEIYGSCEVIRGNSLSEMKPCKNYSKRLTKIERVWKWLKTFIL